MEFIDYRNDDLERCIAIFHSNLPTYFTTEEETEFIQFLQQNEFPYWVVKHNDLIVGCGGIYVSSPNFKRSDFEQEVGFAWGMIEQQYHQQGFGKALTKFRLNYLLNHYPKRPIVLRTTQHTYPFFEQYGFTIHNYEKNGYGDNMDKITMVYKN